MKSSIEYVKKIGASIIVFLLILMLGLTLSRQPIDEIINLISGKSYVGEFNGKQITTKEYERIRGECESRFQQYGLTEIPPQFLNSCIYENMQDLYVKPIIADELGLGVSKESIENKILESVKSYYETQKTKKLADELLPLEDLYNRELYYMPIEKRIAYEKSHLVDKFFMKPIPASSIEEEMDLVMSENDVILVGSLLAFSNKQLMDKITVNVSEEELRAKYEEERKNFLSKEENKNKNYPTLEEKKIFLKETIENEKKRSEISKIKEQLGKQKFETFDDLKSIESIVGLPSRKIEISLSNLESITFDNNRLNLNQNEFLKNLLNSKKNIGPLQSGDYSVYFLIDGVKKVKVKKDIKKVETNQRLAYVFYDYLLKKTKERGNFSLNFPIK